MPKSKNCPYCDQPLKIDISIKKSPKKASEKIVIKQTDFNSEESIAAFLEDKKLYIAILGEFFRFRGDVFLSPEEFKHNTNANIKAARLLASLNFELEFYTGLFQYTENRLAKINKIKSDEVYITNLNTSLKFLQKFKNEYPGYEPKRS